MSLADRLLRPPGSRGLGSLASPVVKPGSTVYVSLEVVRMSRTPDRWERGDGVSWSLHDEDGKLLDTGISTGGLSDELMGATSPEKATQILRDKKSEWLVPEEFGLVDAIGVGHRKRRSGHPRGIQMKWGSLGWKVSGQLSKIYDIRTTANLAGMNDPPEGRTYTYPTGAPLGGLRRRRR